MSEHDTLIRDAHALAVAAEAADYIADHETGDPDEAARVHGLADSARELETLFRNAAKAVQG